MNFNFGEVLSRAWQITWKHKVLWIFGLLASCASGTGNSYRNTYQERDTFSGNNPLTPEMSRQMIVFFQHIGGWFMDHQWAIYGFIIFVGLLIILQLFLATVGQTGLVRGAYQADGGVNLRFGTLWSESLRFFWRATGLGFLLWAPLFALLFIVFFGYLVSMDISPRGMTSNLETFLVLSFISFCCCMVPLILVISFFQRQALSALVVEDIGVFDCLARAWNVITKRFGELFIMGLIMFGIGMVVGLVLATPVFVITIPLMTAFLGGSIRSWIPFLIAFMLLLAYSPISWFLSGIYRTFSESAWTLTYMRLTQKSTMGDGLTSQTDNPQNPRDGDKTILATPNA